MTAREKLAMEHPEEISPGFPGGTECCPCDLGYLPPYEDCLKDEEGFPVTDDERCTKCWDREMPEEKPVFCHQGPVIADVEKDGGVEVTCKPRILDSGNRRQFESGAVRDIQEGKGRCDLLPLDVVANILNDELLNQIESFQRTGDVKDLYVALEMFASHWDDGHTKASIYDIIVQRNCTMLLEVAIHFEEGAKKYGDNNWQKGIPVRCYIDSGVRHYLKFLRGDKDEPHDRAFCWNIMCAIWTCKHKPELNEYKHENVEFHEFLEKHLHIPDNDFAKPMEEPV